MFLRKRALERIASEKVLFERHPRRRHPALRRLPQRLSARDGESRLPGRLSISSNPTRASPPTAPFCPTPTNASTIRARGERLVSFERGGRSADFDDPGLFDLVRDRLPQSDHDAADGRVSRCARRARRTQLSADHRRRLRGVPQSRADRRFRRSVSDRRGRGDGARVPRALIARPTRSTRSERRCARLAQVDGAYLPDYFTPDL